MRMLEGGRSSELAESPEPLTQERLTRGELADANGPRVGVMRDGSD
ncbi:MAG: hypothetical protein ACHREM_06095 [Polyangiales bacterium]